MPPVLYGILAVGLLAGIGWVWFHIEATHQRETASAVAATNLPVIVYPGPISNAPAVAPVLVTNRDLREAAPHTGPAIAPVLPLTNALPVKPAPILPPATQVVAVVPPAVQPTNLSRTLATNPVPPTAVLPKTAVVAAGLGPATNAPGTGAVAKAIEPPVVPPPKATNEFPRPVKDWFEAQLALDRLGISSGSIDGVPGAQTRSAMRAFQAKAGLRVSGELDDPTRAALVLAGPPCVTYRVTAPDMDRLQPLSPTWLGKSQQTALDYETILELLAEKSHAHPKLIQSLNPNLRWGTVGAGASVCVPDASSPPATVKAALVVISLGEKTLEAFDAQNHLLAHFPCSIARLAEKRPVGDLHVVLLAPHPNYTFKPEIFPESAEARRLKTRLVLPAGPNNPVGVAWIGLDKPGYGIHGTPSPELVGRTESHGCFRLANWNAKYLLSLAWVGMPVRVVT